MHSRRILATACAAALLVLPAAWPVTTGHADSSFHAFMIRPVGAAPAQSPITVLAPDVAAPNVDASNESGPQSETTIAASPANPAVLVAGSNDIADLTHINAYYSSDRGHTWGRVGIPSVTACKGLAGDPSVAANLSGEFFYAAINFSCPNGTSEISVAHSTDGGATWTNVVGFKDTNGGVDKEQVVVDDNPNSPTVGRIYVSWDENLTTGKQNIELIWSDDNGLTWHAPVRVDVNGSGGVIFADPAVGPDGRVYDIWIDYGGAKTVIKAAAASNTPAAGYVPSFTTNTTLGATGFPFQNNPPAQPDRGVTSDPSLQVSGSGQLYALWTKGQTGKAVMDIEFQSSKDSGATWSSPVQVNDDNTPNQFNTGATDFFPWGVYDNVNNVYTVSFYSTRRDSTNQKTNVYTARSTDGGVTFSHNLKITTAPSNESVSNPKRDAGNNYGDYEGLTAGGRLTYPVWTDTRKIATNGEETFTLSH